MMMDQRVVSRLNLRKEMFAANQLRKAEKETKKMSIKNRLMKIKRNNLWLTLLKMMKNQVNHQVALAFKIKMNPIVLSTQKT